MKSSQLFSWRIISILVSMPFKKIDKHPFQLNTRLYIFQALFFLISLSFISQIANAAPPAWLTENYQSINFDIFYATKCPDTEPDCTDSELIPITEDTDGDGTPDSFADHDPANGEPDWIEHVATFLEELLDKYDSPPYLLRPPNFTDGDKIPVYITGKCGGSYNGSRIRLCPRMNEMTTEMVLVHEMFHGVQASYLAQPRWIKEGQAVFMEDQVFQRHDSAQHSSFKTRSNNYLGAPDRFAITDILQRTGYEAAWFWKYFAEHVGDNSLNPGQGIDAIRTLLETGDDKNVKGIEAINSTLEQLAPGSTFQEVFQDFLIANYARKLIGPDTATRYLFTDEMENPPNILDPVHLDEDIILDAFSGQIGPLVSGVRAWGARYYRMRPTIDLENINIYLTQDTNSQMFFALLGIKNGEIVQEERFISRDFNYTFINNEYDEVVLIVGGLNYRANYRLRINARECALNIVEPTSVRPAQAGDPQFPHKILIKVELLDSDATPVEYQDKLDFEVKVGAHVVPKISFAFVQGQYWMVIQPPDQMEPRAYSLTVNWKDYYQTSEPNAILYDPRPLTDIELVIDHSGSMEHYNKMEAAINAANLYIDSFPNGDRVGVVSFSSEATINFPITELLDQSREDVRNAVAEIRPFRSTSIGAGLITALNEFVDIGNPNFKWSLVLLSDGREMLPPYITDFWTDYYDRIDHNLKVPTLHVIGLGPDANRGDMQDLAIRTGGVYQFAAEPPEQIEESAYIPKTIMAATAEDEKEIEIALELADIYRVVSETEAGEQQIFSQRVDVPLNDSRSIEIQVDSLAEEAEFILSWAQSDYPPAISSLRSPGPDSQTIQPTQIFSDGHYLWRISQPVGGTWTMRISCYQEFCIENYLVEASLKSDLTLDFFISPKPEERFQGMPISLLASLSDLAPVQGATVHAEVISPDKIIHEIFLFDDGKHGDGAEEDGVYGYNFHETFEPGSYIVRILAEGVSNLDEPFVRRARGAFHIEEDNDSDGDGLPDIYEEQYGSNPLVPDDSSDIDLDGLTLIEEYYEGTDPRTADTDYGGEADGSEVDRGSNPKNAIDDVIYSHGELYVTPGNGYNQLEFENLPTYDTVVIFRSLSEYGDYSEVGNATATGRYRDSGLINGQTYWYRVVLLDGLGRRTPPTDPVPGTPKADSVPPDGWIVINGGAEVTYSQEVLLTLSSSDDGEFDYPTEWVGDKTDVPAMEMRISNDIYLDQADWEPFMPEKVWNLTMADGLATVYIQFRDAELNVSDIFSDDILIVPTQMIDIDIKPGNRHNCVNLNGKGVIPVAIMGSADFNVREIDTYSLKLEDMSVRVSGNGRPRCSAKDSNRDGHLDLICHFEEAVKHLGWHNNKGTVSGELFNGIHFEGSDSICMVP